MLRHNIIAAAIAAAIFAVPTSAMACPASLHMKPPTLAQIEYSGVHVLTGWCSGRVSKVAVSNSRLLVSIEEHYTHDVAVISLPASSRPFFGVGRVVKLKSAPHGGIAVIPMWGGRHRPIIHAPAHDTVGARVRVVELFNR